MFRKIAIWSEAKVFLLKMKRVYSWLQSEEKGVWSLWEPR